MRRVLVELSGGAFHQLLAGGEAEDPGHRFIAIENAAVDRGSINTGQIALEEEAMPLFACTQSGLGAVPLHGVDENLAADAKQRHSLLAPRLRNGGWHAQ